MIPGQTTITIISNKSGLSLNKKAIPFAMSANPILKIISTNPVNNLEKNIIPIQVKSCTAQYFNISRVSSTGP